MSAVLEAVGVGVALYLATNLDDLFLLIALFSDRALKPVHVVAGHYAGMAILYGAGVAASLAALVLPASVIGLLGIVPMALGAWKLRALVRGEDDDDDDDSVSSRGGFAAVTAITLASGGDNIAIYTPVFAVQSIPRILVTGAVFAVMIALWTGFAWWLTRHPKFGEHVRSVGRLALPFVLIGIGAWVLVEGRSWELLR